MLSEFRKINVMCFLFVDFSFLIFKFVCLIWSIVEVRKLERSYGERRV